MILLDSLVLLIVIYLVDYAKVFGNKIIIAVVNLKHNYLYLTTSFNQRTNFSGTHPIAFVVPWAKLRWQNRWP